jgi:hypothetical protein
VAVPTSGAAGCNDDLLDHRLLRIIHINNLLALPLNLEFHVARIRKLALAKTGALKIPVDAVKTAETDTEQTAATIPANANCLDYN